MKHNMTMEQTHPADYNSLPVQTGRAGARKPSPSWTHTILWMLSMALLANVAMGLLFYVLYHYNILH